MLAAVRPTTENRDGPGSSRVPRCDRARSSVGTARLRAQDHHPRGLIRSTSRLERKGSRAAGWLASSHLPMNYMSDPLLERVIPPNLATRPSRSVNSRMNRIGSTLGFLFSVRAPAIDAPRVHAGDDGTVVMAAPRNDRPAGRALSDGPVGSDTGVYHLFAGRASHIDQTKPTVCGISNAATDH